MMQFMSGRYGVDRLFYVLFAVAAVLSLINCFVHSWVLQLIVYAVIVYAFFRVLSRNIGARSEENRRVLKITDKFSRDIAVRRQRRADVAHIYKKCPYCRAVLRLPRRRGRHKTVCPKCSREFNVRVYRD